MNGIAGTERLTAIVVDDEPLARERLSNLLEADEQVRIVAECADAEEALHAIDEVSPDIVFLDVQMPGQDGFELLERVAHPRPYVIFVTAHEEHALRAFESEALDYLVKPFSRQRLASALERAVRQVRGRRSDEMLRQLLDRYGNAAQRSEGRPVEFDVDEDGSDTARPLRKIVVRSGQKKLLVDVNDIDWVEAADYYARLHTGPKSHLVRRSLAWLQARLDSRRFVRIHRSAIVNVDRVKEISPWSAGSHTVVLEDGSRLRMSASRRADLARLLGQTL